MSSRNEPQPDSRERILQAAFRVFARKGFQRASLDEIASEAELTKGAIYWHFRSKNDLFCSLMQQRFQHNTAPMPAELARVMAASDTAARKQGIAAMLTGMLGRCFGEDGDWPRLYLEFLSQSRTEDIAAPLRELSAFGRGLVRGMMVQMQEAGLARTDIDVDMLSAFWCALMDGYMMAWVVNPEAFDADRRMDQLVDMLWRGMAPGA